MGTCSDAVIDIEALDDDELSAIEAAMQAAEAGRVDEDDDDDDQPLIVTSGNRPWPGSAAAAGERRPPVAEEAPLVLGPRAGVVAARVLLKQKLLVIAGTY